jgi:phosphoglycerate kinase
MDKLTVRDFEPHGKWVFLRVDFNVPLEDGRVTDDSRVRAAIPTIHYLLSRGARVVLASHLGRPDGKVQDGLRLRPVGERLSMLLRRNVPVTGDALGLGTEDAVKRLRPGEALLLENLRFHSEEENNDPKFATTLAGYAEIYVNDAFGTAHRAHASTVGVPKLLPAYAGLLMEREIAALSKLLEDPEHPFVAIVGGAKVSGKLKVLENLVRKVDKLILGGGMANTFLLAQGKSVGKSLAEHDMVDQAKRILSEAESRGVQVILPVDVIVAKEVTRGTEYKTLNAEKIPASWHIVDVGRQTLTLIEEALADARTVMWNGPIGVFEIPVFGAGTRHVARVLADKADGGATVVVGGGDSVAAVQQQGLASRMTHISTGGGASLEFLEGRELPGIAVLQDRPAEPEVTEPAPAAASETTEAAGVAVGPGRATERTIEPVPSASGPGPVLNAAEGPLEVTSSPVGTPAAERQRPRAAAPRRAAPATERRAARSENPVKAANAERTQARAASRSRPRSKPAARSGRAAPRKPVPTTARPGAARGTRSSSAGSSRASTKKLQGHRPTGRKSTSTSRSTAKRTTHSSSAQKSTAKRTNTKSTAKRPSTRASSKSATKRSTAKATTTRKSSRGTAKPSAKTTRKSTQSKSSSKSSKSSAKKSSSKKSPAKTTRRSSAAHKAVRSSASRGSAPKRGSTGKSGQGRNKSRK